MRRILYILLLVLSNSLIINAQLSFEGEFRPRPEFRNGFRQLRDSSTQAAEMVTQRTRLSVNYKSELFSTKVSVQDVRVWGDEKLKQDIPSSAFHEAWVQLKVLDSLAIKVGRQELSYDNQRLLGSVNWLQQAMAHDAVVLKFHSNGWIADVGVSFNQVSDTILSGSFYSNTKTNYKSLNYLWLTKKINNFNISGLAIADVFQKAKDTTNTRLTYGAIAEYQMDNISVSGRGFLQGGHTVGGQTIKAYYFSADFAYSVAKFKPAAGFEYISGNDNSDKTNKNLNAFNTLYGTGHKFNGNMEYFLKPENTKNAGLIDFYIGFSHKATDKLGYKIDYHYFSLQKDYLNPATSAKVDKYLGSEIDFSLKTDISKEISLEAGYSFMAGGKTLEIVQGRGDSDKLNHWGFIMLTIKPVFFKN